MLSETEIDKLEDEIANANRRASIAVVFSFFSILVSAVSFILTGLYR